MKKISYLYLILTLPLVLFSCQTMQQRGTSVSREITGTPVLSEQQLTQYFMFKNPSADKKQVQRIARLYIQEGAYEGINSDVAFAQMCLETGYLTFGNLVVPEMHNYCGLGAIDAEHPGETFATEQLGVRAHIQHLHAYATKDIPLNNECIDTRYKYVNPRGKSPTIEGLAGTWAADKSYTVKLEQLLVRLESF